MDIPSWIDNWPLELKNREYNKRYLQTQSDNSSVVYTPEDTVNNMLDLLPKEIWRNPDITFLNLFCKDGAFLNAMYWRLFDGLKHKIPDFLERSDHILTKQLYGLSPLWVFADVDELSLSEKYFNEELYGTECVKSYAENSRFLLYGQYKANHKYAYTRQFKEPYGNIRAMYKVVDGRIRDTFEIVKDKGKKTLMDIAEGVTEDMKFDVVIGNPPYNRGMDLDFVNLGFGLCKQYCVMITPAKWQTAAADQRVASKTINYGEFRKKLVPHMSKVVFYPDAFDVFDIKQLDGITYYIICKDKNNKVNIENKCKRQELFNSIQTRDISNGETLHNIGNDIVKYLKTKVKIGYKLNVYNTLPAVYVSDAMCNPGENIVSLSGDTLMFSPMQIIKQGEEIKQLPTYNQQLFNGTIQECESFISWINTKLVRFMVLINVSVYRPLYTDNCFRFVPAPPSGKFDHIYTDEELYKAFNLPQKYIDVIEAVIKERK